MTVECMRRVGANPVRRIDATEPEVVRLAAAATDPEQVTRILARNALLGQLHGSDRRIAYDAMAGQTLLAPGVGVEPVDVPGINGYWLHSIGATPGRAVLYVHGGGYHLGSARSYLGFVSQIAAVLRCSVLSIDYPLAPDHPFPAAYDGVVQAWDWLTRQPGLKEVAAVGDSAGAGLVLAMVNAPSLTVAPSSVVVFSPWTDLACTGHSFSDPNTHDPVFQPEILRGLAKSYLAGAPPNDPRASPLYGIPDRGPPLLIQVGSEERLFDDAARFAKAAAGKFASVRLEIYDRMFHVFQRDHGSLETARLAIDHAARFIFAQWPR